MNLEKHIINAPLSLHWKQELAEAISSPTELLNALELGQLAPNIQLKPDFRLRVPRAYVKKMQIGDPHDPLLLQVLPALEEINGAGNHMGLTDPVGDLSAVQAPGLLHKYHGRVLLITTGACAIHCRYCFRRHFPYAESSINSLHFNQALEYLHTHTDIHEVILSGGDPLVLSDSKLADLCAQLETVPHLRWLRIHTRLPVVLPSRITKSLTEWMQQSRFRITVVIHSNHANELTERERQSLQRLQAAEITLLNQSVLLKGVNDTVADLIALSERLHDFGVIPYYLHLLDKVEGGMHFEVPVNRSVQLVAAMRENLPGFLVPQLVQEEAGKPAKTAIFSI